MHKLRIILSVTIDQSISFHQDLILALAALGHEVHVISSPGKNLQAFGQAIRTYPLEMARDPRPIRDLVALFKFYGIVRKIRPDIVIGGTPKASLLSMIAAKFARAPRRVFYSHGLRLESATGLSRRILHFIERVIVNSSTEVIAVSPSLKKALISERIAKESKVFVLGSGSTSGIDLEKFFPMEKSLRANALSRISGIIPNIPVIGFVGRITRDKGVAELLAASMKLAENGVSFQLLLLGEVEDEEGRLFLEALSSAGVPYIHLGRVNNPEYYMRLFDVFCLPSYREGLPLVVLEAFASGAPIVATNVTGITDLIEDEVTGLLVSPRDSDALSSSLARLLEDRALQTNLALKADGFVKSYFEKDIVLRNHLDFLLREIR